MMITQRRSHSISQNAKVDDEETPMMSMMNPLVEDNDDDGGYNEDGKMNVIGVEHGDLYDGDDEADSSRVLFLKRALRVAEALRYPFIFVRILLTIVWLVIIGHASNNETDQSIRFAWMIFSPLFSFCFWRGPEEIWNTDVSFVQNLGMGRGCGGLGGGHGDAQITTLRA
ncbi:predicted protein [Thalassiosira pseudonana CCMP1335]|uniref:Uncharacterized protein n=1 Tax=Thalassiosira pseudonana TaxID=35128 RepID=B8CEH0_THAPS|nr:predicted protein [Thalassiosira pseudonana CCMP1335]EED87902.1 predicted protein [Thalassiosira pseudonana CCMP1335]